MGLDGPDRVLTAHMKQESYDPFFCPNPMVAPPSTVPYDPDQIFNGKDFGKPATGDGE